MVLDRAPDAVHEDLDRLRAEYDDVPVYEEVEHFPPEEYDLDAEKELFRFASAWVRHEGEVLLVQPRADDGWIPPGGTHEPGESYEETARRETREEAGVDCRPTGIVEARVGITEFGDRAAVPWMGVVFEADYLVGDPRPEPGEIDDVGWFSELPEDLVFERVARYPL